MARKVFGMEVEDLAPSHRVVEVVSVVKTVGPDGEEAIALRTTAGITNWEAIGMLMGAADVARRGFLSNWPEEA